MCIILALITICYYFYMGKIKVLMDPAQREKYLQMHFDLNGLPYLEEDREAAYTSISLTSTPDELKPVLKSRQEKLKAVLNLAKIHVYDPGASAKYNPDLNRDADHKETYLFDSLKVMGARYFSGHLLVPSIGVGNEAEKAVEYNRIPVMFLDRKIRISRMLPFRTIYLAYDDFDEQSKEFVKVFEMLKEFDPGMGLDLERPITGLSDSTPILVGFPKGGKEPVDMEEAIYTEFPHLKYAYDPNADIVRFDAINKNIFMELKRTG
jgi:hypothetical protein